MGGQLRPKGQIAELRAYVRQRERLLEYAASHIQHMQKALTVGAEKLGADHQTIFAGECVSE